MKKLLTGLVICSFALAVGCQSGSTSPSKPKAAASPSKPADEPKKDEPKKDEPKKDEPKKD